MESLINHMSKDLITSVLATIILLLFVSNVYFYVGYKELEYESTYKKIEGASSYGN